MVLINTLFPPTTRTLTCVFQLEQRDIKCCINLAQEFITLKAYLTVRIYPVELSNTKLLIKKRFLKKWGSTLAAEHFPNAERVFLARDRSRDRRTVLVIDHYVPSFDKDAGSRSTWLYLQLMVEMGYNVKFIGANFFPPTSPIQQISSPSVLKYWSGKKMARGYPEWLSQNAANIDTVYVHRPHIAEQFSSILNQMNPRPKLIYFGHDLHFLRVQRESVIADDDRNYELCLRIGSAANWAVFEGFDKVYYASQG